MSQSQQPEITPETLSTLKWGCGSMLILAILIAILPDMCSSGGESAADPNNVFSSLDTKQMHSTIDVELKSFQKTYDPGEFRANIKGLLIEVGVWKNQADLAKAAISTDDESLKNKGLTLGKRIRDIQISQYPVIRARYAELLQAEFEANIPNKVFVKTTGDRNEDLFIVSPIITSSEIADEMQAGQEQNLKQLRYRTINYSQDGNKYRQYELSPPKDSYL